MKRDLLIAGVLIVLAALGIGAIVFLPGLLKDDSPRIIKPRTEPIAYVPKKEEPKKLIEEKKPPAVVAPIEKKREIKKVEEKRTVETEPKKTPEVQVPDYFLAALKKNKKALATFEAFSPSHRREYVAWVVEAKQEATRQKRLAQAVEWLAEGKSRNWKYERK